MLRSSQLAVAASVLLADQAVKYWLAGLRPGSSLARFDMLGESVAFSSAAMLNHWFAFGFGENFLPRDTARLLITGVVALSVWCSYGDSVAAGASPSRRIAAAFALGGGIGNLVDRLWFGAVRDVLAVSLLSRDAPTIVFNLADCAIALGVSGLILLPDPPAARESEKPVE